MSTHSDDPRVPQCYSCRCRVLGAELEWVSTNWPARVITGAPQDDPLSPTWVLRLCPVCANLVRLLETLYGNPLTTERLTQVVTQIRDAQAAVTTQLVENTVARAPEPAEDWNPWRWRLSQVVPEPASQAQSDASGTTEHLDPWTGYPWQRGDDPDDPRGGGDTW